MTGGTDPAAWATDRLGRLTTARESCDHPAAGLVVREMAARLPAILEMPQVWARITAPVQRFYAPGEGPAYLRYLHDVLEIAVGACQRLADPQRRQGLAQAIVGGLDFRLAAHSDEDIGPLMRRRAALYRMAIPPTAAVLQAPRPPFDPGRARPRLAVLFRALGEDPESTSLLPFFERARAAGLAVSLFAFDDAPSPFRHLLEAAVDEIVVLPQDLFEAARAILARDADLLLHGSDVTAKPSLRAYLSFLRLARVQMCAVSTLMTTQSPFMDVYLGSPGHRAIDAPSEFSERYLDVPAPGFAFRFPDRPSPPQTFDRAGLGIGPDKVILVSGANHTKLHRDLLDVWATILRENPQAVLLLYPYPQHYAVDARLQAHVQRPFAAAGVDPSRVKIMPQLKGRDVVKRLLAICDLGLDSFPYPGVTTVVDAVEAELPTVCLRGRTLRANQSTDILASVGGLDGLMATDVADYVAKAGLLIRDPAARAALRARIVAALAEGTPVLQPDRFADATAEVMVRLVDELREGRAAPSAQV